ncbi:MAG: uracil-DNA glycosylase [Bacteroidota bacterium]
MLSSRLWSALTEHVLDAPEADDLVNPYSREDAALDVDGAAAIRRDNLSRSAESVPDRLEVLVVAEAPGPWGCRFSGVPLVSESQLLDPDFPLDGRATSLRAMHGEPLKEYSGGIYWRVMRPHWGRFWTWNAVPFHPHKPGDPLTIRAPRVREIRQFAGALEAVVAATEPERVVALGRVAERALTAVGVESRYVRHPSQGGARLFEAGMAEVFGTEG